MDSLGDRMKGYEAASQTVLPGRLPVILRVDGKAFHTYTRGAKRPFDDALHDVMNETAKSLCSEIQGAQFAYVQSDEISVLIHGYKRLTSSAWFDNRVMKMVSVASSIASTTFSMNSWKIWMPENVSETVSNDRLSYCRTALFDARAFVLSEAEVCNYFIWRQQDAIRNSVQSLARSYISHRECDGMNVLSLKEKLLSIGVDWSALAISYQRGRCIIKQPFLYDDNGATSQRFHWIVDNEMPLFVDRRYYVNDLLKVEEE